MLLKTADKTVAEELANTDTVQLTAMLERRIADFAVPVAIDLGVLTAECLQLVEHLPATPHLLNSIRAE
jgi:hypothetical protein